MKPQATSREAILASCRAIVRERGIQAVSVRAVASATGVATGTLYHYFPDKQSLLTAVVADVWSDVFDLADAPSAADGFVDYVEKTFRSARERLAQYPGFAMAHGAYLASVAGQAQGGAALAQPSASESPADEPPTSDSAQVGRQRMCAFLGEVRNDMLQALEADPRIKPDAFGRPGTPAPAALAGFVTQNLLVALVLGQSDCSTLLAMLRAALY